MRWSSTPACVKRWSPPRRWAVRACASGPQSLPAFATTHDSGFRRSRRAGRRWNSALPDYHGDPATYARFILDLIQERPTRVVIPSSDGSIAALRPWRSYFERHDAAVALASESALAIANNKERTLAVAQSLGIAGPRTAPVADLDDARAALAEVGYPAVIKPTESWVRHGCTSNRHDSESRTRRG